MLTYNKKYFALAVLIFVIEVLIALFVRDRFVRPYLGDVLVVILIYCFVRSFLNVKVYSLTVCVLLFAFTIELLQYVNYVGYLGLQGSPLARTVMGTSFAWNDMLAYVAGAAIILLFETWRSLAPILRRSN